MMLSSLSELCCELLGGMALVRVDRLSGRQCRSTQQEQKDDWRLQTQFGRKRSEDLLYRARS